MNRLKLPQLITLSLSIWMLLLNITACTNNPPGQQTGQITPQDENQISAMIKRAKTLPSPDKELLLIDASLLLLEQNQPEKAEKLLQSINTSSIDADTQAKLAIAMTQASLALGDIEEAEKRISTDTLGLLTASDTLESYRLNEISLLRAEVWEYNGNFLSAARERIFVAPMLPEDTKSFEHNHKMIWTNLINVPTEQLEKLAKSAAIPDIQGWLELAWIYKNFQDDLDKQLAELQHWQTRYPGHTAQTHLPESLQLLTEIQDNQPEHIAILLPLKGKYHTAAQAILNGFMSAHFQAMKNNSAQYGKTEIRVYDTGNTAEFSNIYEKAITNGADIVLGPLQKENVRTLAKMEQELPVTTIALNRDTSQSETPSNLFSFSLAPEDDAHAVAQYSEQLQYTQAAVLYKNNAWNERTYAAFAKNWLSEERSINSVAAFDAQDKMANAIKDMLLIQLSENRANQLRRITGQKIEFQPRRRQDIDFIYLVTTPEEARQIRPLLDFYYAQDIQVLAGSQIYSGVPAKKDRDLDGIQFSDIPWLLEKPGAIKQAMQAAWPKADYRYFRLNAMGVDAYRLQSRITLLAQVPEAGILGATGNLTVGPGNIIFRDLSWAVFKNGQPKLLPKIIRSDSIQKNHTDAPEQPANVITKPYSKADHREKKAGELG